ncbi:MAG TPA: flagellar filament capping protein FliD [Candidatus Aquilonibacter sp.]|nr:flagellar filament capping protein FliD [Candidatus Aquilonibacter sp.]
MGVSLNPSTILSGQGIDVSSVVQQILSSQSGQLTVWENQSTTLATQNGVLDGIENDLTNLQTAVAALADPTGALAAQAVTSSNAAVVTATAQSNAVAGTHQIVVNNLATTGTLYTDPVSDPNVSFLASGQTSGDVQLQVGGTSGTTYDIPITQGTNDTLNTLASYINSQSSANNWGVTASVVSDASGSRLALESQNTGSAGALALGNNSNTSLTFDTPQGGTNASLDIDGVPFSSTSNTVSGAIQGVTLNLLSATPDTAVQLTVAPDTDQISSAVNNFVSAYNTVVSDINAQYAVDPTGATPAPPLESDTSLRSLQSSILADASYAITGNSGLVNLASLGINMNNDGSLTVGSNASGQTFAQVVGSNPSAVQNFFQNSTNTGFANIFNTDLTNLTDPTTGPLNAEVTENTATEQGLSTSIANFQTQLSNQQTALTSQYDSVNASLQAYPLLLQEVTETLGTLNSGTSSTGQLISSEPTLTSGL